jgi:hypothetical protein
MQVWDFSLERSPVSMDNYTSVLHTQRIVSSSDRLEETPSFFRVRPQQYP